MAGKYCWQFFHPEKLNEDVCDCEYYFPEDGSCRKKTDCWNQVIMTSEQYLITQTLRSVKLQNIDFFKNLQKQK